jgi:hypothetical protein
MADLLLYDLALDESRVATQKDIDDLQQRAVGCSMVRACIKNLLFLDPVKHQAAIHEAMTVLTRALSDG